MKILRTIVICMTMMTSLVAMAENTKDGGSEMEPTSTTMVINGNNIHVSGANGTILEVYNLTGSKVGTYRIDSNEKTFSLNLQKGCYILKIGDVVRKISIK